MCCPVCLLFLDTLWERASLKKASPISVPLLFSLITHFGAVISVVYIALMGFCCSTACVILLPPYHLSVSVILYLVFLTNNTVSITSMKNYVHNKW